MADPQYANEWLREPAQGESSDESGEMDATIKPICERGERLERSQMGILQIVRLEMREPRPMSHARWPVPIAPPAHAYSGVERCTQRALVHRVYSKSSQAEQGLRGSVRWIDNRLSRRRLSRGSHRAMATAVWLSGRFEWASAVGARGGGYDCRGQCRGGRWRGRPCWWV